MRLYTLTNFYLSSIQKGIQTAHIVHELYNKYPPYQEHEIPRQQHAYTTSAALLSWAMTHRTIIVLNGGCSADLEAFESKLAGLNRAYPWVAFREDQQSLNGAITAVGIILPEEMYDARESIWEGDISDRGNPPRRGYDYQGVDVLTWKRWDEERDPTEFYIIDTIKHCGLAI